MSTDHTRREFLATAGATLAMLVPETLCAKTTEEPTMTAAFPSAFAANHAPKPLPFDPAKLDGLSVAWCQHCQGETHQWPPKI